MHSCKEAILMSNRNNAPMTTTRKAKRDEDAQTYVQVAKLFALAGRTDSVIVRPLSSSLAIDHMVYGGGLLITYFNVYGAYRYNCVES